MLPPRRVGLAVCLALQREEQPSLRGVGMEVAVEFRGQPPGVGAEEMSQKMPSHQNCGLPEVCCSTF